MKSTLCPTCRKWPRDVEHTCIPPGRYPLYFAANIEVIEVLGDDGEPTEGYAAFLEVCCWDAERDRDPQRIPCAPQVKHVAAVGAGTSQVEHGKFAVTYRDLANEYATVDEAVRAVEKRVAAAITTMREWA